ncbi:MAG: formylglycine-generating enzyme family protein [Flavobacterium sp.]|uniref:Formylglycine-generating enzyme, required for sulfatase activity, contains SUMF1/FGE domain n=1 Tax=Myroides marinus TaxID=703342 RepID=A0A1H6VRC5_9FLAO|nr:formylglycine-generating enzyme family protein [Myroides marinus]MDM1360412.1 formylglycine-generating enzyme family protein [Myroides marinus]MDM1369122.1 formylglycine-generating enzyme family protein [Myroides marinus]MDM1372079.1 formylglycine-generating enzyme family protein [Myroides marinus]MDM1376024.1 formylglycine-generating enzyme family protein [Myroides marinus]MDM1379651.1 formylglycine-generating enzyme family protein [Myroides marinus]
MFFLDKSNIIACLLSVFTLTVSYAQKATPMVTIKGGTFVPLYGSTEEGISKVASFKIDQYATTNEQYVEFLKKNPTYQRSQIKGLFANKSYLSHWKSDLDYGDLKPNAPVTNVSWFAAKKYCEVQGKRLPTMDEWEYVAMADAKNMDAREKEAYNKYILAWYETPKTYVNPVGSTFKNYWGVYDMHGLIWEWVSDYNSIFLSGESRKDKGNDENLFCGSASINASDLMDYAAFMRYGFRGSLRANFTTKNLGFRCAQDL